VKAGKLKGRSTRVAGEIEKVWVAAPSHDPNAAHKSAISFYLIRRYDALVRADHQCFSSQQIGISQHYPFPATISLPKPAPENGSFSRIVSPLNLVQGLHVTESTARWKCLGITVISSI